MTPSQVEKLRYAVVATITSATALAQIVLTDALPYEAWAVIDLLIGNTIALIFLIWKPDVVQEAINREEVRLKNQERFGPENGD